MFSVVVGLHPPVLRRSSGLLVELGHRRDAEDIPLAYSSLPAGAGHLQQASSVSTTSTWARPRVPPARLTCHGSSSVCLCPVSRRRWLMSLTDIWNRVQSRQYTKLDDNRVRLGLLVPLQGFRRGVRGLAAATGEHPLVHYSHEAVLFYMSILPTVHAAGGRASRHLCSCSFRDGDGTPLIPYKGQRGSSCW